MWAHLILHCHLSTCVLVTALLAIAPNVIGNYVGPAPLFHHVQSPVLICSCRQRQRRQQPDSACSHTFRSFLPPPQQRELYSQRGRLPPPLSFHRRRRPPYQYVCKLGKGRGDTLIFQPVWLLAGFGRFSSRHSSVLHPIVPARIKACREAAGDTQGETGSPERRQVSTLI